MVARARDVNDTKTKSWVNTQFFESVFAHKYLVDKMVLIVALHK